MRIGTAHRVAAVSASRRATANLKRPYERFTYTKELDGGMMCTDTVSGMSWRLEPYEGYPQPVGKIVYKKEE